MIKSVKNLKKKVFFGRETYLKTYLKEKKTNKNSLNMIIETKFLNSIDCQDFYTEVR